MPDFTLKQIAGIMNGRLIHDSEDFIVRYFEFDSRMIKKSQSLFFAFKSETGDGHKFIEKLDDNLQVAAVVSEEFDYKELRLPMIIVKNPMEAAEIFASEIRKSNKKTIFIAVTGSVGKTTTKEFCYQILSNNHKVFRSYKNWNNWIGLPFSIMKMKGDEDYAIFELGMSTPGIGEINNLVGILKPQISMVLNVFPVHLEFLKTIKNIARAKAEIFNYLGFKGTGFINGDSEELLEVVENQKFPKIFFGLNNKNNDVLLSDITRTDNGTEFKIKYFGEVYSFNTKIINRIQIENLFVSCFLALFLKVSRRDIQNAIDKVKPVEMRGEFLQIGAGLVIDESYNSNPFALKKTLDWIDKEYRTIKKIAVVGDMLELGDYEEQLHLEAGEFFSELEYSNLLVVGKRAQKIASGAISKGFKKEKIKEFSNSIEAGKYLKEIVNKNESFVVVFKGSRGMQMELGIEEFSHE